MSFDLSQTLDILERTPRCSTACSEERPVRGISSLEMKLPQLVLRVLKTLRDDR